jgi:hypothetical protein
LIHGRHLTIVEDDAVTDVIAQACLTDSRLEDVYSAIILRISRDPECGDLVQDNGIDYRLVVNRPLKIAKNAIILVRYRVYVEGESLLVDFAKVYPYDEAQAYSPPAFDLDA